MCQSCEVLTINGVACHEIGCPDAWRDSDRECRECGEWFAPEASWQTFCDDSCYATHNGLPCDADDD